MGANPLSVIIHHIAQVRSQAANSDMTGTVSKIQGSKMRVNIGNQSDGTPWLSPWVHTSNHRGGSQDHQQYAEGQTVKLSTAGGDIRQASVSPYARSNAFKGPAQMPDQPSGDYAQIGGKGFETSTMDGSHNQWISKEDHSPTSPQAASGKPETGSGDSGGGGGGGGQQSKPEPKMIQRMDPDDGHVLRFGDGENATRVQIFDKTAQVTKGKHSFWVDKDGLWVTSPPKVKKISAKNNDKFD